MILGGAMENTLLTCEGLHARGHEVTLITGPAIGPEGELLTRARSGGYRVIVLDALRREIHPVRDWRTYRQLQGLIEELRPEVVHTHASKAGILGRRAAHVVRTRQPRLSGLKIVHTIHGLAFHPYGGLASNRLYIALERRAAGYTDAFICVADAMTAQALAQGVGRSEQYTTIYSGMEIGPYLTVPPGVAQFRRQLGLSDGQVLVSQVSRLAELKGHEYILQAARQLADERIHFCFVGDGHLRSQIQRRIVELNLEGRVHLMGLLEPERIPLVMHASDILVHCSLREGLARALPQAMLAGRPVVSFDVDGANEVVNLDTGILLEPRDVAGLALAIRTLADSPPLRQRLGAAGQVLASRRFDHNLMVDRIQDLYERITRSSGEAAEANHATD